jgi:hypothetical protein
MRKVFEKNLHCSMTCSQIWLSPLLDDLQSTYLTILFFKIFFKEKT